MSPSDGQRMKISIKKNGQSNKLLRDHSSTQKEMRKHKFKAKQKKCPETRNIHLKCHIDRLLTINFIFFVFFSARKLNKYIRNNMIT